MLKKGNIVACKLCNKNTFKEKLGRCPFCIRLNLFLLVASGGGWFISYQSAPREVATIALLLTFIASALLMLAHIGAYLYYRYHAQQNSKRDKHSLK